MEKVTEAQMREFMRVLRHVQAKIVAKHGLEALAKRRRRKADFYI